jgi:hypothetical protein
MAGMLAAGLAFAASTTAHAQERSRYGSQVYQTFEQRAYENGYREGIAQGETDARSRLEFSFGRSREYRDADAGFQGGGDSRDYRLMFRRGFEAGYADGYEGRARESGPLVPRASEVSPIPRSALSPAAQIGFEDGYDVGRSDARDRESYDPVRSNRYRDADHHYEQKYGTRDDFKRLYRLGFEQGYEQGYRIGVR